MLKISEFSSKKIVFGNGALQQIGGILSGLSAHRVLVVTDKFMVESNFVDRLGDLLKEAGVSYDLFTDFEPSPTMTSAESCYETAKGGEFQAVIGFGGGSSMDMAKAGAVLTRNPPPVKQYIGINLVPKAGLPIIAIPTTSGTGSEVTNVSVLKDTQAHTKGGIVSPYIIPDFAIVDPMLTLSLPPRLTASTGMDALSHAVEGYTSLKATFFSDMLHKEAIKLVAKSLRTAVNQGQNLEARYNMSIAATLAGMGLGISSAGAAHALSYPVEGNYSAAHGDSCASLLCAVARYNAVADMEKFRDIAVLMGENIDGLSLRDAAFKGADAIETLSRDVGIPTLNQIGVTEKDLDGLTESAFAIKRLIDINPRVITPKDVRAIYKQAL
jgi:alcohol dehydrogenase class IV